MRGRDTERERERDTGRENERDRETQRGSNDTFFY